MSLPPKQYRVLDLKPREDQASKPTELIQIHGHESLTLNARRSITILWHNAHRQGIEENKDYTIEIADLVPGRHKGYEMVEDAIIQLMQTIVTVKRPDGSTRRVQFLGGNDMDDPSRAAGALSYSFDKRLIEILKDSSIWGKISLPVLMALSSKYAVSLYENIAQCSNLNHKHLELFTLEEFRNMLGIEKQKYPAFGAFNKHILKPVVAEINALAAFGLAIQPVKTGKKVTHVSVGWWIKDISEQQQAWAELQRPKSGRKERIQGQVDMVFAPSPSSRAIARRARLGAPRKLHKKTP